MMKSVSYLSLFGKKPRRIIDQLREQFPNQHWQYIYPYWLSEGMCVRGYAKPARRYDGDEEYVLLFLDQDQNEIFLDQSGKLI